MSQGDALCDHLLRRGIAVLRPDYPGIGGPGVHPYLLGRPLGGSLRAMVRARRTLDDRLGDDWVAAGHSEGAVAALFAGTAPEPDDRSRLRGVAAVTPVTRMDLSIRWSLGMPGAMPGSGVVSALIGLMLRGAATADPALAALIGLAAPDRNGVYVAVQALNAIEGLGEKARPLLAAVKSLPLRDPKADDRVNPFVRALVPQIVRQLEPPPAGSAAGQGGRTR